MDMHTACTGSMHRLCLPGSCMQLPTLEQLQLWPLGHFSPGTHVSHMHDTPLILT